MSDRPAGMSPVDYALLLERAAHDQAEITAARGVTPRDQRILDLYHTPKRALAAYYREHSGYVWSAVPPERWSKDQLVSDILRLDEEGGK